MTFRSLIWALSLILVQGFRAAQAADADAWRSPMSNAELAAIRGGYVALDGISFTFGATLQTFVNGELALNTSLVVTGNGAPMRTVNAASGLGDLTQSANRAVLALNPAGGSTTLLQQLGSGGYQNVVTTTASNQVLSQNTNLTLELAGFQQNQATYQAQHVLSNLTSQINFAMSANRH